MKAQTITRDADATRLLVGKTIKSVHLDLIDVQDHGSGTYGVDLQTVRRSKQKGKRVSP